MARRALVDSSRGRVGGGASSDQRTCTRATFAWIPSRRRMRFTVRIHWSSRSFRVGPASPPVGRGSELPARRQRTGRTTRARRRTSISPAGASSWGSWRSCLSSLPTLRADSWTSSASAASPSRRTLSQDRRIWRYSSSARSFETVLACCAKSSRFHERRSSVSRPNLESADAATSLPLRAPA